MWTWSRRGFQREGGEGEVWEKEGRRKKRGGRCVRVKEKVSSAGRGGECLVCAAAAEDGCGYGMAGQRCERESEWVGGCVASVRYRAPGRALYRLNRSACAPGLSPPLISSSFGRQDLPLPESLALVHRHDSPARPRRLPSPPLFHARDAVWSPGRKDALPQSAPSLLSRPLMTLSPLSRAIARKSSRLTALTVHSRSPQPIQIVPKIPFSPDVVQPLTG